MSARMTRTLGRSGIEVSAMGMGCWAIGGPFWSGDQPLGWGEVDDDESIRTIDTAIENGITFFDTADVYGAGHSERILGKALTGMRERVIIATKFGNVFDEDTRQVTGSNASPQYIREACEASLRRLNTDYIDLYQFHLNGYDAEKAPEIRDTLERLTKEGKIRAYGWSTDFIEGARIFAEGPNCTAIQHTLNVIEDAPEMLAFCEAENQASINRSPLAMGLLTGKFQSGAELPADDVRAKEPDWMVYFKDGQPSPEWLEKIDAVREILTSEERTLAQGALAWIWGRSEQTIPIPGCRTVAQIEENSGAMAYGPLTPEQMRAIDDILGRA